MADRRTGTGKVIADAAKAADVPVPPVQLPLLGEAGAVDVAAEVSGDGRRRGRPAGAGNLVTRELRAFIQSQHRHPLVTLARIQAQDPNELARRLGCKPVEALDRINRAAAELAPYLVGKMPVEDANGNAVLPVIQLVDPALAAAAQAVVSDGVRVLDLEPMEMAEFSHSCDDDTGTVGRSESDGLTETKAPCGFDGTAPVIGNHDGEASR